MRTQRSRLQKIVSRRRYIYGRFGPALGHIVKKLQGGPLPPKRIVTRLRFSRAKDGRTATQKLDMLGLTASLVLGDIPLTPPDPLPLSCRVVTLHTRGNALSEQQNGI